MHEFMIPMCFMKLPMFFPEKTETKIIGKTRHVSLSIKLDIFIQRVLKIL